MTDSTPKKRKYSNIATVTLYVGKNKTAFNVHEHLLCEHSKFFKAAFESNFKEGNERTMTLPEDEVGTFEDFVHWLYTKEFEIAKPTIDKERDAANTQALEFFFLAEKYNVSRLKTRICNQMVSQSRLGHRAPDPDVVCSAYAHLPEKSGMRRLLIDWYASTCSPRWYVTPTGRPWLVANPEIAADLITALANRVTNPGDFGPLKGPRERYHDDK